MVGKTSALHKLVKPLVKPFVEFIQKESSSGIILLISSVVSLVLANSDIGFAKYFPAIWENTLSISVNTFRLEKTLSHWINDGLMALFFLIVGLEIKREVLEGELSSIKKAALPLLCALGGMVMPALLFTLFNYDVPTRTGWGIPMATDIAFALAILYVLGDRIPLSLKVFLTALAIADDLGAVLVIALFYTQDLSLGYLGASLGVFAFLLLLNFLKVKPLPVYLILGLVMWYFMLKSGIHATIAGMLLAITIPFRIRYSRAELQQLVSDRLGVMNQTIEEGEAPREISEELEDLNDHISSPAQKLENQLHGPIAFFVIPLFAFCNTSIIIDTTSISQLLTPLSLGIMAGLFIGKPLGISLLAWLAIRLGWATLPQQVTWKQLIGVSWLAGIGFTMSIFITLLAFANQENNITVAKLAVLLASLLSGLVGYFLLQRYPRQDITP